MLRQMIGTLTGAQKRKRYYHGRRQKNESVKEVLLKVYLVKNKFFGQFWFEAVLRCCLLLKICDYHAPSKYISS